MAKGDLYQLTEGDRQIFELAKTQPNALTNYYLKTDLTGTWWLPGAQTPHWSSGYTKLKEFWRKTGQPENFVFEGRTYATQWSHEMSGKFPELPAFHQNHGFIFLPYQEMLHKDMHPFRTIVGGFGSGKTVGIVVSMLLNGVTLPGYRGFGLAPYSLQAAEMYKVIMDFIADTEFERRFLVKAPEKPNPMIVLGNDLVGKTSIEFYPILGNSQKIRTLTGDEAAIDQAEKLNGGGELDEVIRSIGTRFRGRVAKGGRGRLGRLTFIANADENQELWELYDMAEEDPENYLSISPSSFDNIWLTDADLHRFAMQVGKTPELKRQYLFGDRPLGNGEVFSRVVQEAIRSQELDDEMNAGLEAGLPDYIKMETKGPGVYEWLLPPKPNHNYVVISDPGTKNPPKRDTGVIMVFDITGFPGQPELRRPATLAGFIWVYGNGDIKKWASRYAETVQRYNAVGTNGFDATGFQSGYVEWLDILENVLAEKINLAGNAKYLTINAAKVVSAHGMVKMPVSLSQFYAQMGRYVLPEPQKLRQDLVITFAMACWWLQRMFYINDEDEIDDPVPVSGRYHRASTSRYPARRPR